MILSRHELETYDIRTAESAKPVQVVGMCRCGEWHMQLDNSATTDRDEQIVFAFEAHEAGLT